VSHPVIIVDVDLIEATFVGITVTVTDARASEVLFVAPPVLRAASHG